MQVRVQQKETLLLFSITILIITIGGLIIWQALKNRDLSLELFEQQQQAWQSLPNFADAHQQAVELYSLLETTSEENFRQYLYALLANWPQKSAITHLASSRQQLRAMAQDALLLAQENHPQEELRFFDRLYARDPIISILLNQPEAYLFLLTTIDQKDLIIISLAPNLYEGGYYQHLWHTQQDINPTLIENLLLLYHQVIR